MDIPQSVVSSVLKEHCRWQNNNSDGAHLNIIIQVNKCHTLSIGIHDLSCTFHEEIDGLEVPCQLALIAFDKKLLDKATLLLQKALPVIISKSTTAGMLSTNTPVSARNVEHIPIQIADVEETATDINKDPVWIHIDKCTMLQSDKLCLLTPGCLLNDKHINTAQALLKKQFTNATGLQSTLFQYKSLSEK